MPVEDRRCRGLPDEGVQVVERPLPFTQAAEGNGTREAGVEILRLFLEGSLGGLESHAVRFPAGNGEFGAGQRQVAQNGVRTGCDRCSERGLRLIPRHVPIVLGRDPDTAVPRLAVGTKQRLQGRGDESVLFELVLDGLVLSGHDPHV